MNSFTYWSPTKIVFGADTAVQIGSEVKAFGGTNVLIIYGAGSVVKSGLLDKVKKSLADNGLSYSCVGGVQPNPLAEFAQKIVDDYRDKNIDFVLGVGGGSAIDTAKAVALGLAVTDTPVWEFFCERAKVEAALPIGVILTIAAAGSETSDSAVLTSKTDDGTKRGFGDQFNRPKFAILDPTLTYTLPPRQTACGITDIMMHTMDRYFANDIINDLTDELAEAVLRITIKYGRIAMEKPDDYKARAELMWAGSLSHIGLTGLGNTVGFDVHQLGHSLSALYDVPHGESLSIAWPSWARYVYRENISRFARYARNVWGIEENEDEVAAVKGIDATEEYFKLIKMPVTISEAVGEKCKNDIDELTDLTTFHGSRTTGAFKVLRADDIKAVFTSAI